MYPFERTDNTKTTKENVQRSDLGRDLFRLDCQHEIEYEYDFRIQTSLRFLNPRFGREGSSDLMI